MRVRFPPGPQTRMNAAPTSQTKTDGGVTGQRRARTVVPRAPRPAQDPTPEPIGGSEDDMDAKPIEKTSQAPEDAERDLGDPERPANQAQLLSVGVLAGFVSGVLGTTSLFAAEFARSRPEPTEAALHMAAAVLSGCLSIGCLIGLRSTILLGAVANVRILLMVIGAGLGTVGVGVVVSGTVAARLIQAWPLSSAAVAVMGYAAFLSFITFVHCGFSFLDWFPKETQDPRSSTNAETPAAT